ncbi:hypothetical protein PSK29_03335 [Escherichia coli]|nr:hypothetical protein [Escherichia coli]
MALVFLQFFDADMREKINNLVGKVIPVISLPSIDGLNPEEEIWRVFSNNISHVAQKIGG